MIHVEVQFRGPGLTPEAQITRTRELSELSEDNGGVSQKDKIKKKNRKKKKECGMRKR